MNKKFFYVLAFSPILGYLIFERTNLPPYYFIGFFCFALYILNLVKNSKKVIKIPKFYYLMFLLFIYYFIWDFNNGQVEFMGGILKDVFKWDFNPLYLLAFLALIEKTNFDEKFIEKIIKIFKITIILAAITSLIQLLFKPDFLVPGELSKQLFLTQGSNIYNARRPSLFGYLSDNDVAVSFIPILSIVLGYSIKENKKKHLILYMLLGGVVCILTNGRYVIIGYLIILSQLIWINKASSIKIVRYFSITLLLIGFFALFLSIIGKYQLSDFFATRLMSDSADTRILAYDLFLKFFGTNIFFGNGQSLSIEIYRELAGRSSQIHVGYFSHLISYGLIGSLILFTFWLLIFKQLLRNAKATNYYGSLFAFIIFLWANVAMVWYMLYVYGLIFAFIFDKYYRDQSLLNNQIQKKYNLGSNGKTEFT